MSEKNETATNVAMSRHDLERRIFVRFGFPPSGIDREGCVKWMLACIERMYLEDARHLIEELAEIKRSKPTNLAPSIFSMLITENWKRRIGDE
jgi:hypothetical protein